MSHFCWVLLGCHRACPKIHCFLLLCFNFYVRPSVGLLSWPVCELYPEFSDLLSWVNYQFMFLVQCACFLTLQRAVLSHVEGFSNAVLEMKTCAHHFSLMCFFLTKPIGYYKVCDLEYIILYGNRIAKIFVFVLPTASCLFKGIFSSPSWWKQK